MESAPVQHYEVLVELGDCRLGLGDLLAARPCYEAAAALGPDYLPHQAGLASVALLSGEIDQARELFDALAKKFAKNPEGHWGLAMVHQRQKNHPAAKALMLKCLQLGAEHKDLLLGLFESCHQCGDYEGLALPLQKHLDLHPGDTDLLLCQAHLQNHAGDAQSARQTLLTILALAPDHLAARRLLAQIAK